MVAGCLPASEVVVLAQHCLEFRVDLFRLRTRPLHLSDSLSIDASVLKRQVSVGEGLFELLDHRLLFCPNALQFFDAGLHLSGLLLRFPTAVLSLLQLRRQGLALCLVLADHLLDFVGAPAQRVGHGTSSDAFAQVLNLSARLVVQLRELGFPPPKVEALRFF